MKLEIIDLSVIDAARDSNKEVGRTHAEAQQIRNINLSIVGGDKVFINGVHQSEKLSTFMRILMKVISPSSGSINIEGKVFPFLTPLSGIRYRANVEENLILRALQVGHSFSDAKEYAKEILLQDNLSEYRLSIFGDLPRDLQILIACKSFEYFEPQILVLESWVMPASESIKNISHNSLVNLVQKSEIALVAINRPNLLKPLSNYEMMFGVEQGIELSRI